MRVKVTFTNGTAMFGKMNIPPNVTLGDVLNSGENFVVFIQPNDREVLLNKQAIAYIVEDADDYI